jgi:sugar lactone lactonase YvrE/predicted esterase
MVFLHGSGQRGTNVEIVAANGPPMLIERGRDFPCVVISPQCSGYSWDAAALEAFIRDLMTRYRIDPFRVYVTGLSMGGFGTWDLAVRTPALYAAVVPICGGGNPTLAYRLRDLPLWAFHGALDATVPVSRTQEMINAIQAAGGSPRVTIYPDGGHDVWTVTYANNDLYTWLFAQSRPAVPISPIVTTPPSNQTTNSGQSVAFVVEAGGNPAPACRWQRLPAGSSVWEDLNEGGSYYGVRSATLDIFSVTVAMSGDQFRCVLTNAAGSAASSAVVLTVAGTSAALLQYPVGIAGDAVGNLYVADSSSNTIRKITSAGLVSTLAGTAGVAGSQDGLGSGALFNQPGGLTVDANGNVFVADTGNATIRRITPGGSVTTVAGSPARRGSLDGPGAAAAFNSPGGIAVDGSGALYVADAFNATIRRIALDNTVSTLAGSAGLRGDADGTGSNARFNFPGGLAVDHAGNLYVADTYNDTLRRIAANGTVSTLAGSAGISGAADLTGVNALFNQPGGVAVDSAGNVYVADTGNGTVRLITGGGVVTTVAGTPGIAGARDSAVGDALFNQPRSLAIDGAGNLFVADTGNAAIRKITPTHTVTTLMLTAASTGGDGSSSGGATAGTGTIPGSGSGGESAGRGGGGAMEDWFAAALALIAAARTTVRRKR